MQKIIAQGAEAIILKYGKSIIKERIRKGYRHEELDNQLRKRRTRSEAKIISKAAKIIPCPEVIDSDETKHLIEMQFIDGKMLSAHLDDFKISEAYKICREMGKNIAKLHNEGIIHGDLTTSNMIFKDNKVFFIDFGLSFHSSKKEDKAVDIHLMKQALESKHFEKWEKYFEEVMKGYEKYCDNYEEIKRQFEKVEGRGRYKGKH
ncbi:MAG: KEOPS complex kinase/ATPase Bud32 [archaeon]